MTVVHTSVRKQSSLLAKQINTLFKKGVYLFSKQTALLADACVNHSHVFSSSLEEKTDEVGSRTLNRL